jgi:hypothetical protein
MGQRFSNGGLGSCNWVVLTLNMVDNSTNPFERISGWFFVSGRSRRVTFSLSEAPSEFFCWRIHPSPLDMILHSHLASEAFKQKPAARGGAAIGHGG